MVEFRAFKGGVFVLEGRYETDEAAHNEQKRYNRLGQKSSVKKEKTKSGDKVFELWLKD